MKELTDIQLKAIAYDNLVIIENAQANLKIINEELKARAEVKLNPVETPKKK